MAQPIDNKLQNELLDAFSNGTEGENFCFQIGDYDCFDEKRIREMWAHYRMTQTNPCDVSKNIIELNKSYENNPNQQMFSMLSPFFKTIVDSKENIFLLILSNRSSENGLIIHKYSNDQSEGKYFLMVFENKEMSEHINDQLIKNKEHGHFVIVQFGAHKKKM